MLQHTEFSQRFRYYFGLIVTVLSTMTQACAPAARVGPAGASTGSLSSTSNIACRTDDECAVCYRADSCGEPIAANDPTLSARECHVSPRAFCMPRRGHCDNNHCVAR